MGNNHLPLFDGFLLLKFAGQHEGKHRHYVFAYYYTIVYIATMPLWNFSCIYWTQGMCLPVQ
jgi:hypothetical protein